MFESKAYFNEFEPYAAAWTRNLIAAGLVAPGVVDERSIAEVQPVDLDGYTQCHFFAGIGVWSHALRKAGWGDDIEIWSGSCPCQGFSQAGRRLGFDDERHLWPEWFRLIRECRPAVIVGEQVASPDGLAWLDLVHSDLESAGYAFAAFDLSAAGFGAPHIRQRLYFVALRADVVGHTRFAGSGRDTGAVPREEASREGERKRVGNLVDESVAAGAARGGTNVLGDTVEDGLQAGDERRATPRTTRPDGATDGVADSERNRLGTRRIGEAPGRASEQSDRHGDAHDLAVTDSDRREVVGETRLHDPGQPRDDAPRRGPTNGYWAGAEWVWCRDGKWRPVEAVHAQEGPSDARPTQPGIESVADGSPAWLECVRAAGPLVIWDEVPDPKPKRTGMLKCYGNAIVGELAVEFIGAVIDVLTDSPEPPA